MGDALGRATAQTLSGRWLAETAMALPGAQFMGRLPAEFRHGHAREWGGAIFALSHYAADSLGGGEAIQVVCAGDCWHLAEAGGRWLTLYGKAVARPGQVKVTVCSKRQNPNTVPKQLLFNPAQRVVAKPWTEVISSSDEAPGLVVLYSHIDAKLDTEMVQALGDIPLKSRVVFNAVSEQHAVVIRRLLELFGYCVAEAVIFPKDDPILEGYGSGLYWMQVRIDVSQQRQTPDIGSVKDLQSIYEAMELHGSPWPSIADIDKRVAFARRHSLVVDEQEVNALMLSSTTAIELDEGYLLARSSVQEQSKWIRGEIIPRHLLDAAPARDPEDGCGLVFEDIAWLVAVLTYEEEGTTYGDAAEGVDSGSEPTAANDDSIDAAERGELDAPTLALVPAHAPIAEAPEPVKMPREWRLSRRSGTTDILALAAMLGGPGSEPMATFRAARTHLLQWLANKGYQGLSATQSGHAEHADGEATIETDGDTVWAMRLDDRRQMLQGAIWRVEMTLLVGESCAIGTRLYQLRSSDQAPEPVSGVPAVVARLARELGLRDAGETLMAEARRLTRPSDAAWLADQIQSIDRSLALVVITSTGQHGVDTSIDRLASRLIGVAHVVWIDPGLARSLSRLVGDRHAVYGNVVRVYRPRFNAADHAEDHPFWGFGGQTVQPRIADLVAEAACAISLDHEDLEDRAPSFRQVRIALSDARLHRLRDKTESLASTVEEERARHLGISAELESRVADYKTQADELAAAYRSVKEELTSTRRERDEALDELRQIRRRYSTQWNAADDLVGDEDSETSYPETWDELEGWVEANGDGHLVLHPSAAKAARESPFEDIAFAYRALDLLAHQYIAMRTRDADDEQPRLDFEHALAELGLDCSPVGTAVADKRYKKEYRRMHEGRQIKLDMHLKRGVGFDPVNMFRLYFWYCEDTQRVVVGHMPTHLTNRITHTG